MQKRAFAPVTLPGSLITTSHAYGILLRMMAATERMTITTAPLVAAGLSIARMGVNSNACITCPFFEKQSNGTDNPLKSDCLTQFLVGTTQLAILKMNIYFRHVYWRGKMPIQFTVVFRCVYLSVVVI